MLAKLAVTNVIVCAVAYGEEKRVRVYVCCAREDRSVK